MQAQLLLPLNDRLEKISSALKHLAAGVYIGEQSLPSYKVNKHAGLLTHVVYIWTHEAISVTGFHSNCHAPDQPYSKPVRMKARAFHQINYSCLN